MKKVISTILTLACLIAIVATPTFTEVSTSYSHVSTVCGNKNITDDIFTL